MQKLLQTVVLFAVAGASTAALAGYVPAMNITVNGSLSDWGVTLKNNNLSNIQPKTVAAGASSPCQAPLNPVWGCEDTNDTAGLFDGNGGYVGPEYGGQKYDAEFMGVARGIGATANKLFIGIASGLRPDNGFNGSAALGLYGPGDAFLKVNGTAYVIEMGGGAPHDSSGAQLGAQIQGAAGSFYNLDSNGYTASTVSLANQQVGSIWKVADGTSYSGPGGGPTQWLRNANAVSVGMADVYSTRDSLTGDQSQHSVWEVSLDMGLLPTGGQPFTIDELHWGPSCYNDVLSISGVVSEPSILLLFGLGWAGLARMRRRKQSHQPNPA